MQNLLTVFMACTAIHFALLQKMPSVSHKSGSWMSFPPTWSRETQTPLIGHSGFWNFTNSCIFCQRWRSTFAFPRWRRCGFPFVLFMPSNDSVCRTLALRGCCGWLFFILGGLCGSTFRSKSSDVLFLTTSESSRWWVGGSEPHSLLTDCSSGQISGRQSQFGCPWGPLLMLLYFIFSRDKSDMAPLCRGVDPALQSSLNRYHTFVLHLY